MADRPLYVILEIQPDATPEEIKRAYHRLALQYHPDRAGPESAEKFQQILAAYSLLSDPEAREVYDKYGEQGLSNMEAMPAMQEVGLTMSSFNFFRVAFALIAFVSVNGIIFLALLAAKLDDVATYSWHVAVCPGYVVFASFSLLVFVSIVARIRRYCKIFQRRETPTSEQAEVEARSPAAQLFDGLMRPQYSTKLKQEFHFWMRHFISLSLIITGVLVIVTGVQRERGVDHMSWWAACSPALFSGCISFATTFVFRDLLHLSGIHSISTFGLVVLNSLSFSMNVARLADALILVCILEGYFNPEPYLIAIATEVYWVLACAFLLACAYYRQKGIEKISREMPYMSEEDRRAAQKHVARPNYWIEVVFFTFTFTCFLLGTIFTSLTPVIGNKYQLAFIPLFVYFGVMLLASVILFACFTIVAGEVKTQSTNHENNTGTSPEEAGEAEPSTSGDEQGESASHPRTRKDLTSGGSRRTRQSNESQGESNPNKPSSARTMGNSELREFDGEGQDVNENCQRLPRRRSSSYEFNLD